MFHLLDFHRRADKPGWWQMFARRDMDEEELIEDGECIGAMELDREAPPRRVKNSVPRSLREQLPGHEVKMVAESGWAGVKNGELLRLAAQRFDVLLTVDRNLEYQQNFLGAEIAVVVVHAPSNDIVALQPLMPRVLEAIPTAPRGKVTNVE